MKKIKENKNIMLGISASMFVFLISILFYASYSNNNLKSKMKEEEDYKYVDELFETDEVPVVGTSSIIIKPYTDENVKIIQNFYNYKSSQEEQENSIINYEETYLQNKGVSYGKDGTFDVVSILDGTVVSVKQDKLLGNVVEIKNNDKVTSVYQSLGEVFVKENDKVIQGQAIGKSGISNINKDLGEHLDFELKINGVFVNPEEYYNKDINTF